MLSAILLMVVATASGLRVQSQDPAIPFSQTGLALDLRLDYPRGRIDGTATLTLRNVSRTRRARVPLLLNRLMRVRDVRSGTGPASFVQDVVQYSDDSTWQVRAIEVTVPGGVAPGDSVSLALTYGGTLVGYAETGSLYIRDRVDSAFTIIREDALAFPVLGVNSQQINRRISRQAFWFTAAIDAPVGQVVAMGGEPASPPVTAAGRTTTRWRSVAPVGFLNITVAPYLVLQRGGIRIYHFAEDSVGAQMVARGAVAALERLAAWFGPLDGDPQLTVMEIPAGFGSQASLAAGIIQSADAFRERAQLRQLYHELTHLWNVEDLDVPSPRWNEGLASFLQYRVAADLDGWNDWANRRTRLGSVLLSQCRDEPRCGTVAPIAFGRELMTDYSYSIGQLMFLVLFDVMGMNGFDRAYRTFLEGHHGGGTTDALMTAFETVDRRARAVFDDWMRSPRWFGRLSAGETVAAITEEYRRAVP